MNKQTRIYEVTTDTSRARYRERQTHLVAASSSAEAIRKACREAVKTGAYTAYDAIELKLIGEAI
jgi:hypothetical protein